MCSATAVDPTKLIAWTRASLSSTSTASRSPLTTFSTPWGSPASSANWAISSAQLGSRSEGFKTNVLPQTTAIGHIQSGTMHGKLNGVMPTATPSGWNSLHESIEGPTLLEYSPLSNSGAPQAYSMFSMPRCTSPMASLSTLPCSSVI